jgi:hypothetical protein
MSVPPPRRLAVVHEAERADLEVTGPYRYHAMRRIAPKTPAAGRM